MTLAQGQTYAPTRVDFDLSPGVSAFFTLALYESAGNGTSCSAPLVGGPESWDVEYGPRVEVGVFGEGPSTVVPSCAWVTRGTATEPAEVEVYFAPTHVTALYALGAPELWWRILLVSPTERVERITGTITLEGYGE